VGQTILRAVCLLGLLAALLSTPAAGSANESVWEREGLEGRTVRALALAQESGTLYALIGGVRESMPLWQRDRGGWSPVGGSTPDLVLALVSMPGDGVLLATGRDISDRPGVYHLEGAESGTHWLYTDQAVGALAVARGDRGPEIYAASAPWSDRDGGAELLWRDPETSRWAVVHRASLTCPNTPFFPQVATVPSAPSTLYVVEWCRAGQVLKNRLWRSDDRAVTWRSLPLPIADYPLIGTLAVDPADPEVVFVAGLGNTNRPLPGLELSLDGGQSWTLKGQAVPDLVGVRTLLLDPSISGRVVVGTQSGAVFVSDDRGDTWRRLPGLEGLRIWHLLLDPATGRLLAATSDGVWRTTVP
jgi:hypothetical protein